MKHIYHSHTIFCKHAKFTVESIVKKAFLECYETIGISEHIFSEEGLVTSSLTDLSEALQYIDEVNRVKKLYSDKIRVLCGFELEIVDYFKPEKDLADFNKKIISLPGVDFAVFSCHYQQKSIHIYDKKIENEDIEWIAQKYQKMFETGIVKYVAHPDAFVNGNQGWDERTAELSRRIIALAVQHNVILAVNINGLGHGKLFPALEFWKMAGEMNAVCTLELDAHSNNAFNQRWIDNAYEFAKQAKIKLVDKIF